MVLTFILFLDMQVPNTNIFWKKCKYWKKGSFFIGIKTDTKLNSNYQPENLIINAIIRAESRIVINQVVHVEEKSFIHDIYKPTAKQLKNAFISFSWIRSFPNEYQKLLEQEADFLLEDDRW